MMKISNRQSQSGAALAVSLILLLVITLLVLSGGRDVLMQEKMVSAQRDGHMSLAAVESGLEDAAKILQDGISSAAWNDSGTGGYYNRLTSPSDVFALGNDGEWQTGKKITAATNYGVNADQNAEFYFEKMGAYTAGGTGSSSTGKSDIGMGSYDITTDSGSGNVAGSQTLVRVVVRATGRSGNSERIVVAYYPMND